MSPNRSSFEIGAEAGEERPEIVAPVVAGADVALIDTRFSPIEASGIGSETMARNLFVTRYRLIPRAPGVLRIPPVRVKLGTRTGATAPLQVEVHPPPLSGRPAAFRGGVGAFSVTAEASARTLRVGESLVYTIRVSGPAARGMIAWPDLSRFLKGSLGIEVEPLARESGDRTNPPEALVCVPGQAHATRARRVAARVDRGLRPGEPTLRDQGHPEPAT